MAQINLKKATFPIIKTTLDQTSKAFLGTGFFMGDPGQIVTVKHLFEQNPLGPNEVYCVINLDNMENHIIRDLHQSDEFDLATGFIDPIDNTVILEVNDKPFGVNDDVVTAEYSQSALDTVEGKTTLVIRTSLRKGYAVSNFKDFETNMESIDFSFPAVRGASGAPVIINNTQKVAGVIYRNVTRELLPVQHDKYTDENGNLIQDTKFYMPNASAITYGDLAKFMNGL